MNHIEIDNDYGCATGYVVASNREQIGNYLSEYTEHAGNIAVWLKDNTEFVGILKNLNVEEDVRGKGHGNNLLECFVENATHHQASAIFLISDSSESQLEGFDLDQWYAEHGFVNVTQTGAGAFMVYPQDVAERMIAELFSNLDPGAETYSVLSP